MLISELETHACARCLDDVSWMALATSARLL